MSNIKMSTKISKDTQEKISLGAREVLLCLVDTTITGLWLFDSYNYYRDIIRSYKQWRKLDKEKFYQTLYRLKKQKYIRVYQKDKEPYLKLTSHGRKRALQYLSKELKIKQPKKWDKKWRIVIFDIPKDEKLARDVLREKLKQLGFLQLQKSVFIYPYDCYDIISYLKEIYSLEHYIQYIVADFIDTDYRLIGYFFDQGILKKNN